jgi:GNAT superfamily N-acetyltransferase
MSLTYRRATVDDAAGLAGLRWRRATEERGYTGTDLDGFVRVFAGWMADHEGTHLPFVAEDDGKVAGMAWLMVTDRVPTAQSPVRYSGDVQSVFVAPELRDRGVGARLMGEVLAEARRRGLERVTVHSTERAVPFYQRLGFTYQDTELSWRPDA